MRSADCEVRTAECGLQLEEWRFFIFYSAFSIPQSAMLLAPRLLPIGHHAVEGDCQHLLLGMVGKNLHLSLDRTQLAVPFGSEDQAILLAVLDRSDLWDDICRRTLYL